MPKLLARFIEPMACKPADALPTDTEEWLYEVKWDGDRVIAVIQKGEVRLYSRKGKSLDRDFPSISWNLARLGCNTAVVDGEIVGFDEKGLPSFQSLQNRSKACRKLRGTPSLHVEKSPPIVASVNRLALLALSLCVSSCSKGPGDAKAGSATPVASPTPASEFNPDERKYLSACERVRAEIKAPRTATFAAFGEDPQALINPLQNGYIYARGPVNFRNDEGVIISSYFHLISKFTGDTCDEPIFVQVGTSDKKDFLEQFSTVLRFVEGNSVFPEEEAAGVRAMISERQQRIREAKAAESK